MDFISLEMGLLFLAVFMAPILYIIFKQKSGKKKLDRHIDTLCNENGIKSENKAYIGHYIFVSDPGSNKLLTYDTKKNDPGISDLGDYKGCNIQKSWEKGEGTKAVLNNVTLVFQHREKGKPFRITLFDDNYENPLEAEVILHQAEKWSRQINTEIFR
ncbi:hypothetical protein [Sinomicrobium soli]|uniref:hypothetical protein n=1 Tax=Sinomicrobium sp. N-1-3-6 TaxID=2219864 RepID=UPI000DCBBBD8|nr:hypothetical protein [Sinomicrobium sp. N-1-3-6]RAV28344.1 hypothetical protein DN748_14420 [Sinomicrobium sp. N-1-3-6]